MPWTAGRVTALWNAHSELQAFDYLKKYFDAFAQIANLFEKAGAEVNDLTMAISMGNCNEGDDLGKIRTLFVWGLEDQTGIKEPAETAAVQFAARRVIPQPPDMRYVEDSRHRLAGMRTPQRNERGVLFAGTAKRLLGRWRWVQRASDIILPYRHERTNTTHYTDINGFDQWLQSGGPPPSGTTALNCRDAVLVTAVEAGLLTVGQIRAVYGVAEANARKRLDKILPALQRTLRESWTPQQWEMGGEAYFHHVKKVDRLLTKYESAVPVKLKHGLIPQPGDLVFVRGSPPAHVCLSLGRSRKNGRPVDEVASLWHHNNGRFTRALLTDMANSESDLVYVPCPF